MFIEAYLMGLRNMVESKNDLERLRFMPQLIEGGVVTDFKGNMIFNTLDCEDTIIFDADRVNNTKRYTSALSRDYFAALDKVIPLLTGGTKGTAEEKTAPQKEYGHDILALVEVGDKKGLRTLLKEYKKVQWSALNEDAVEDAIFDLNDCAADKDVKEARVIITDLVGTDICETETQPVKEIQKAAETIAASTPDNEDEAELLQDLEEAIADEDIEDVKLLLRELGKEHPRYAEFAAVLNAPKAEEPTNDVADDNLITEICEDIDAALADNDTKDAVKFLTELADEAGVDSDVYKEYNLKVNPPKQERTRRNRRG